MIQDEIKQNILSGRQWLRMLFMAGYILATWVVALVLLVIILVQTLIVLITGETNHNLRRFGILCGVFMHQIIHFLVYGSDDKPFPFSEFPNIDPVDIREDVRSENVRSENINNDEVPEYSYQADTVRTNSEAASDPGYNDDIIPSTESVNADDEFRTATEADSSPERLS